MALDNDKWLCCTCYFRVPFLLIQEKFVTPAAASNISFTTSLDHIISLDLISCCLINLVWRKHAVCITSTVVYTAVHSHVLGLHTHSPLTHWLTRATSSPASSVSALYSSVIFLSLILYFPCTFSMFRYTNATLLQLPAVSSAVTCCTGCSRGAVG